MNINTKTLKPSRWLSLIGPDSGPLRQIFGELAEYLSKLPQYTEKIADLYGTAWTRGQLAYDKATNKTHQWDGTQWLQQLHQSTDQFWPVFDQNVTNPITRDVNYGQYNLFGRWCFMTFDIVFRASAAGTGDLHGTLPVTPAVPAGCGIGFGSFYRAATATRYTLALQYAGSGKFTALNDLSGGNSLGTAPSFAVANNDYYRGTLVYPW